MSRPLPTSFFDRTPLFIGIVIIPLAATCAFSLGMIPANRIMAREATTEIRAFPADRERRQDRSVLEVAHDDHREPGRIGLHTHHGAHAAAGVAALARNARVAATLPGNQALPATQTQSQATTRGPPRA